MFEQIATGGVSLSSRFLLELEQSGRRCVTRCGNLIKILGRQIQVVAGIVLSNSGNPDFEELVTQLGGEDTPLFGPPYQWLVFR